MHVATCHCDDLTCPVLQAKSRAASNQQVLDTIIVETQVSRRAGSILHDGPIACDGSTAHESGTISCCLDIYFVTRHYLFGQVSSGYDAAMPRLWHISWRIVCHGFVICYASSTCIGVTAVAYAVAHHILIHGTWRTTACASTMAYAMA